MPISVPTATTEPMNNTGEVNLDEEPQQPQEQPEPVDPEQAEQQADTVVSKTEQNPFSQPDIDKLIQTQFNDDFWRVMKGGLPCLETSASCLQQLQEKAISLSSLLKEIDARIAEANQKLEEAKARNKKSIQLSVLTPGLQYLLTPVQETTTDNKTKRPRGFLDNITALFRGDINLINGLLNVVGVPLFELKLLVLSVKDAEI